MFGARGTVLSCICLSITLVLQTLQVKEPHYPVVALNISHNISGLSDFGLSEQECVSPHPPFLIAPCSPLPPLLQLNKDNCSLLAMLSVWLQSSDWLWWLGHRCVICSSTDDGSGRNWPWGYRSGPVPAGPSVQRVSTFFFFQSLSLETAHAKQLSLAKFFFPFWTTPPLCSAGLVKSWAAHFLSEMRFRDSASTDGKKKQSRKEMVCVLVWVKQQSQLWRWRGSVKEQRGSGFVSPRREKSDGMSLLFAPPTRLRIWRHKSARGCRDSSLLLSLRVLFWQGRRKGGWLAYFTFPLFFTLFGKGLEKTPNIYIN